MKLFYLILALSILVQARDVCVPGSCHKKAEEQTTLTCSADDSGKKSCCHKSHKGHQDSPDEGSCDNESCHCLGCLKVFITSPAFSFEYEEWNIRPMKKNTLRPVDFYVFDYTKDFYHPPQFLS